MFYTAESVHSGMANLMGLQAIRVSDQGAQKDRCAGDAVRELPADRDLNPRMSLAAGALTRVSDLLWRRPSMANTPAMSPAHGGPGPPSFQVLLGKQASAFASCVACCRAGLAACTLLVCCRLVDGTRMLPA